MVDVLRDHKSLWKKAHLHSTSEKRAPSLSFQICAIRVRAHWLKKKLGTQEEDSEMLLQKYAILVIHILRIYPEKDLHICTKTYRKQYSLLHYLWKWKLIEKNYPSKWDYFKIIVSSICRNATQLLVLNEKQAFVCWY